MKAALAGVAVGEAVVVRGDDPDLAGDLRAWCRRRDTAGGPPRTAGASAAGAGLVERGTASHARWSARSGPAMPIPRRTARCTSDRRRTGASPRGAPSSRPAGRSRGSRWPTARCSGPIAPPGSTRKAAAAQWDPATAVDWAATIDHGDEVEAAVVQVMTFLVENEEAALVVPARFLGQVHPHFREIQQVLALTVADEARHIEVFTRRATLTGQRLALSTVGGRASLQTLLDEPDFAVASFLLSVMGEGTFVSLLCFLERTPPTRVTRRVAAPRPGRRGPPRGLRAGPPRAPRRPRSAPARAAGRAPWSAATRPCSPPRG